MTYQEAKKAEKEMETVYYTGGGLREPCYIIKSSDDRNLFEIEMVIGMGKKERKVVTSYELEG